MDKLSIDLEGKLIMNGKVVRAKPIGKPLFLWYPEGQEETNPIRLDNIMLRFARSVAVNEIPDTYLEGEKLKRDNINYAPVQFYKLEPSM